MYMYGVAIWLGHLLVSVWEVKLEEEEMEGISHLQQILTENRFNWDFIKVVA